MISLLTGLATPALCDQAATASKEAVGLATEGTRLGRAGRFEEAIVVFKQAYALDSRARYSCNIGLAYARLKRWPQAQFFLRRCVETWSDTQPIQPWVGVRLNAVENALRSGEYSMVTFVVTPPGSKVRISTFAADEHLDDAPVWVPFGDHQLWASKPDYVDEHLRFSVSNRAPWNQPIRLNPVAASTSATLSTSTTSGPNTGSRASSPEPEVAKPETVDPVTPPSNPSLPPTVAPAKRAAKKPAQNGWLPWTTLAAGAAFGAAGIYMHISALDERSTAGSYYIYESGFDEHNERYKTLRVATYGLYAVAAVSSSLGAYLLFRKPTDHFAVVSAGLSPDGASVLVRWRM